MAKMRQEQVENYQYGKDEDVDKVLEWCGKNPAWPKYCEKEKVNKMIHSSGIRIRRFVQEKNDYEDVNPQRIRNIFQCVYVPIAVHEPKLLTHTTKLEFQSEAYQESELRLLVNQILELIKDAEGKNERKLGEPERKPQYSQNQELPESHQGQYEQQVAYREQYKMT